MKNKRKNNQHQHDNCACYNIDKSKRNWDIYFLELAQFVSTKSKDRSTKVGAVIVSEDNGILSTGYNGFPRGINDDIDKRHRRPAKYKYTEHAERNSIFHAACHGIRLKGSRLYLSTNPIPCTDCARAIIQSGIISVIGPDVPFVGKGEQWASDLEISKEILLEAGVTIREVRKGECSCG